MRKLKQELIEKLRKGECVIDNTGNPDKELLTLVINQAFKVNYRLEGQWVYYGRMFGIDKWCAHDKINNSAIIGWNNIIPLKDFEEKELTELPEKWCINVSDFNIGEYIVYNFAKEQCWYLNNPKNVNYFFFYRKVFDFWASTKKDHENCYTEISFEDFKRLVLKENNMKNRKIIGYKAPYDLLDGKVKKDSIYYKTNGNCYSAFKDWIDKDFDYSLIPKEIVETWEPYYEEVPTLPKINGYEGKYDKSNNKIIYGCAEFAPNVFSFLKSANELCKNQCTRTIESITLSSGIKISITDVYQINEFINGKE